MPFQLQEIEGVSSAKELALIRNLPTMIVSIGKLRHQPNIRWT